VTLAAVDPNDPNPRAEKLRTELSELLMRAEGLYSEIYTDVRIVERGILSMLLRANSRMGLRISQDAIRIFSDPEGTATVDAGPADSMARLYRIPFYGEGDAEYEIVIDLSRVPPFKIPNRQPEFKDQELVRIQLLDEKGIPSAYDKKLWLDRYSSTPTMRVYRLPRMKELRSQRFQLQVVPNGDYAHSLLNDIVRYTVSIASLRPDVRLKAEVVRDPSGLEPIVRVDVYGGSRILGATVRGLYQVTGVGGGQPGDFNTIDFQDDGVAPDRDKDDGIYTARIIVAGKPAPGAECRLGIAAFATDRQSTRNLPPGPSDA
jgi:hypothetical protein